VTITVDRSKLDRIGPLVGLSSTSGIVDLALDQLLRNEQIRRDVIAYGRVPATVEDIALAVRSDWTDLADDTDWATLYPPEGAEYSEGAPDAEG
jgi:hypothetical protein